MKWNEEGIDCCFCLFCCVGLQLKMILDDVRIPLKDANGNNFSSNKYAFELFKYLRGLQLTPAKQIKGNTIFITLN